MEKKTAGQKTNIVLIDDHILLRKGLASLLKSLGYAILLEADNGRDFIEKIESVSTPPDLIMLDINMPEMDGYETAAWIKANKPSLKILALTMYDNEMAIIRMLQCGARGYIIKDIEPKELKNAISSIVSRGYYYTDLINYRLIESVNKNKTDTETLQLYANLTAREIAFLKYTCTELNYKEIAEKMCIGIRTVEGYRDILFKKLEIKNRIGLAMYAIKNQLVIIN
jgi:two-component system, NarL family, invasion response regulator UvrY